MIAGDWRIAQLALQIIAEQGVGRSYQQAEALEDAQVAALGRRSSRG